MKTLDEAWGWYRDARQSLKRAERLGERYWDAIPWQEPPWRGDNRFASLSKKDVVDSARNAIAHIEDLAVLVLFSVFEATVRAAILGQLERE